MQASEQMRTAMTSTSWTGAPYLSSIQISLDMPWVKEARDLIPQSGFASHPIYSERWLESVEAIRLWASQELVISCQFSQMIAAWVSRVDNCHLRALIMPVLAGEHGAFDRDLAADAHPYLALKFAQAMGVDVEAIVERPYTTEFLEDLWRVVRDESMPYVAGFFGIGNEKLILVEYRLVKKAVRAIGGGDAVAFLDANIGEDAMHARVLEQFGSAIVRLGASAEEYVTGAREGIAGRARFYDGMRDDLAERS